MAMMCNLPATLVTTGHLVLTLLGLCNHGGLHSHVTAKNNVTVRSYELGHFEVVGDVSRFVHVGGPKEKAGKEIVEGWFTPWTMKSNHGRWHFSMVLLDGPTSMV